MDIQKLMQQAQQFQEKLAVIQRDLAERRIESTVGGGMVTAVVDGNGQLVDLRLDPQVIDPNEPGMLRDLVVAAVNDAGARARETARGELARLTGGLSIPGLF